MTDRPMRDSDIDTLSADGAQEPSPTYRSHYEEQAASGGSRTKGKREWYTDRLGRKRWRMIEGGEADKS